MSIQTVPTRPTTSESDDADGERRRSKQTRFPQRSARTSCARMRRTALTIPTQCTGTRQQWIPSGCRRGWLFAGVLLLSIGHNSHAPGWDGLLVLVHGPSRFAPPPPTLHMLGADRRQMNYSNVSVCTCHPSLGWCSFAHCAPCCHPECTTSPNELAQANCTQDMVASPFTPPSYPRSRRCPKRHRQTRPTSATPAAHASTRCDDYA